MDHGVHKAVRSINNSLMQSKIMLITFPVIISNKILLNSARGSGEAL